MARYGIKARQPMRAACDDLDWCCGAESGETEGREVIDSGGWSEDQPTGLLDAQGNMIYRLATRIGFMAED